VDYRPELQMRSRVIRKPTGTIDGSASFGGHIQRSIL
jgi:hypothetical protein